MKFLRNLALVSVLCLVSAHTADAWPWGKKETPTQEQKKAQFDLEQAQKFEKQAKKALDELNHKSGNSKFKGEGFESDYLLARHEGTLYADLAKDPSKVSLYGEFASQIYNAIPLTDGKHLDIFEVADAIGLDLLAATGFNVVDTFKRWDGKSEQFSGAMLYNQKENTILVVFAGTATAADGYYDLTFLKHERDDLKVIAENYNVHQGFAKGVIDGFQNFKNSFNNIVEEAILQGDVQVITTGHSLGAAMSLIAADWIAREHIAQHNLGRAFIGKLNQVRVGNISFGAPRAFCKKTAVEVEENLGQGNIIRIWNKTDPVPAIVSATLLNAKHVGLNFKIDDTFARNWFSRAPGLADHSMVRYTEKAQGAFERALENAQERATLEAQYKLASEALQKAKLNKK